MEKNKVMMVVIIALLVVLLGTIVGVSVYAFNLIKSEGSDADQSMIASPNMLTPDQIEVVALSSPIATNLRKGQDGKNHIIRVDVSVGVDISDLTTGPSFASMLATKEDIIRDIIIGILHTKTYEDMSRIDAKDMLKQEILDSLQTEFASNLVYSVYIGDMYVD